jgi:hypothetical protein
MASRLERENYYQKILEKSLIRHKKPPKIEIQPQKEINWEKLNNFFKNRNLWKQKHGWTSGKSG